MMKIASNPLDVQDLQFKQQCRLKIFDNEGENFVGNTRNLIAASSRFGLIFVGCNSPKLKVIRFVSIEDCSTSTELISNYSRREVNLQSTPFHISVNCDHTKLAVVFDLGNCPVVSFYDVQSFLKENISILNEIRLSTTPGVKIVEANWHPTIADIFTECKDDGTLGVYELKGKSVDINRLPAESKATCFCWSPKGKQIAVGSKDGKLTHYKPDLKAVKCINAPPFDKPHSIISLQWISNYQFTGVFKPLDNSEEQCCLVTIDAPKTGEPTYTNFYDVCYSNGKFRLPQFYLLFECHWNILLVASSNSMEIGVLSCSNDSWAQWTLPDSARAELPLDDNHEETYPIGITLDTSSVKPIPWGESSLQPAPSLLLLSHKGVLCCFKMINLKEGALSVTSPPEKISDISGLGMFTVDTAPAAVLKQAPKESAQGEQSSSTQKPEQQVFIQNTQVQKVATPTQSSISVIPITQMSQKPVTLTPQFRPQVSTEAAQKTVQPQPASISSAGSLFGGQITITPTANKESKQSSSTSLIGSMLLSNLSSGSSSSLPLSTNTLVTPKPIQQHSNIEQLPATATPKSVQPVNYDITSRKQPSRADQTPISIREKSTESLQENNEEIENILTQMIQMECSALENELKILIFQGKQIKMNLDPKDMDKISNQTKDMEDFIEELVETSESQSSEIYILKQNTIQSWAWLEEARSRFEESENEELNAVLKSRPLDSVSEKHLSTLQQMEYYLESQLSQAHKALDEQWDQFQEYCRKITRVQLPTMEAIFQTMVKQNAILQKHEYILKDLSSQVRGKKKNRSHDSLLNSLVKYKSLEDSFQSLKLEPEDIYRIYYQKVSNRVKSLPPSKSSHLRRMLHNRQVPHVVVKSMMARSDLPKTPETKNKLVTVHMTPTSKQTEVVRNLNFFQSTPLSTASSKMVNSTLSAFAPTNTMPQSNFPKFDLGKQTTLSVSASVPNFSGETISKFSTPIETPKTTSSGVKSNSNENSGKPNTIFAGHSNSQNVTTQSSFHNLKFIPPSVSAPVSQPNLFQGFLANKPSSSNTDKSENLSSIPSVKSTIGFNTDQVTASTTVTTNSSPFNKTVSVPSSSIFHTPTTSIFTGTGLSFGKSLPTEINSSSAQKGIDLSTKQQDGTTSTPLVAKISSTTPFVTAVPTVPGVFSQSTSKPSFFAPISSTQLTSVANISQQPTLFTSAKTSAFTPVTSSYSSTDPPKSVSFGSGTAPTSATSIFANPSGTSTPFSAKLAEASTSTSATPFSAKPAGATTTATTSVSTTQHSAISSSVPVSTSIFGASTPSQNTFRSAPTSSSSFSFSVGAANTTSKTVPTQSNVSVASSSAFSSPSGLVTNQTVQSTAITTSSIFSPTSTVTTPVKSEPSASIFGYAAAPKSTNNSGTGIGFDVATSTTSLFSKLPTSTSNSSSTFGVASSKSSVSSSGSLFSASPTIFGGGATTTSSSIFGSQSTFGSTSTSAFGTTSSLFGQSKMTTSAAPIFGGSSAFGSSSFGSATSSKSVFGTVTSTTSPFGTSTSTPSQFTGVVTSSTPSFGGTTASSSSPFGSASTNASLFGATQISSGSPFGTAGTSSTSPFGTVGKNITSPFGAATTTSTSIFGTVGTTTPSPFGAVITTSSPFGAVNTTSSPFGAPHTTTTSPFGAANTTTTSPFGQASVFGKPAFGGSFSSTPTTSTSVFGQSSTGSSSVFGGSTMSSAFGATTTTPSFGSTATPFGAASSATNTSSFGQSNQSGTIFGSSQNVFGSTGNNQNPGGSFGFGNLNVSGSAQSPFGKTESKSPFGSASFNTASTTGSLFGSSSFGNTGGGSVFGQSSFGSSTFGNASQQSGPFSSGSGSVAQSGFGAAPAFPKPAGFGAQPTFGGSPTFGTAATFGGAPTFGSGSTFGSPSKVFGSTSPTGVFGQQQQQQQQQSPGFGNFANQNTIGFGNLAQQSTTNTGQGAPFSGNSSFSSWR